MVRQPPGDDQATMTPGKAHPGAADGRSVATAARPNDLWDVAVVGAGPAGLAAARVAAEAGARTVVLERAEHPRYKTCGGGLIGASLAAVRDLPQLPARDEIRAATFTLRGGREFTRHVKAPAPPLLAMVMREEFDA